MQTSVAVACALGHEVFLDPGTKPVSPELAGRLLTTGPPRNPNCPTFEAAQGLHIFLQNGYQALLEDLIYRKTHSLPRWPIEESVSCLGSCIR